MKLMSYNIWDGAPQRLSEVIEIVQKENPDYLTINEANTFADNNNKILSDFAVKTGFTYFDIALSGEMDYHVAVFSKFPLKKVIKLKPLARACLISEIEIPMLGNLSIASLHLTPFSEDLRHPEIDLILSAQKHSQLRILMGDMNSLSKHDGYTKDLVSNFSKSQIEKFTRNGKLRFDAIEKIEAGGYVDASVFVSKNLDNTVPTIATTDESHSQKMRLDYIFLSKTLCSFLKNYYVVKNSLTDKASDHYPIIVELIDQ